MATKNPFGAKGKAPAKPGNDKGGKAPADKAKPKGFVPFTKK